MQSNDSLKEYPRERDSQQISLQGSMNFDQVEGLRKNFAQIEVIQRQESFQSLSKAQLRASSENLVPDEGAEKKKRLRKKLNFHVDGFDDNFVGDENDLNYLNSLTQLEREQVIEQRYLNRQQLQQQKKMEQQYLAH